MNAEQLAFAGIARQAELVEAREVSSRELVELYLERIERLDPGLNAFKEVYADRALAEAAHADRRVLAGEPGGDAPLLGVPLAVKDVEDVEGEVTAYGTGAYDEPARADSELVRRLREAGAVVLGKTNLPELAICGFTESKTNGATRNPWNPTRTPSGSSGGSSAAVAAGLCAGATASDGAGSIRNPAAFCALFGLKPQRDRVPMAPLDGHWRGMSVKGAVTRTVLDTALFLDAVMARASDGGPPDPARPYADEARTRPGRLRIALSVKPARAAAPPIVTDAVKGAVDEAGELLRGLGHEVAEHDPRWGLAGNNIVPRYLGGIADDVRSVPHADRLEARTRGFGRLGSLYPRWVIERAVGAGERDARRIGELFERFDVLITPVIGEEPFEVGRWEGRGAVRTLLGMSRTYCFAPIWNHTGQPAASVPMGFTDDGLPRAVQLVGRSNDEATLISLAAQIEAERPWADRRPPIS